MSAMGSQITSLMIVYSTVYSGADKRKHQSSVSLAFVRGIHRWPVHSPYKGPITRKMFPFDDVIMAKSICRCLVISIRHKCPAGKFTLSWYERNFARQVLKLPKESKLYAEINNERSACVVIEAGVSHGFILGSLLFLIYTSDIPNVGRAIRFILCAIDSNSNINDKIYHFHPHQKDHRSNPEPEYEW